MSEKEKIRVEANGWGCVKRGSSICPYTNKDYPDCWFLDCKKEAQGSAAA